MIKEYIQKLFLNMAILNEQKYINYLNLLIKFW